MHVLLFSVILKGLQLAGLLDAGEWILLLEEALSLLRLVAREGGIEAEERHSCLQLRICPHALSPDNEGL